MGKLFALYLAIYNDENLLNGVKSCQIRYKIFPNSKLTFKIVEHILENHQSGEF